MEGQWVHFTEIAISILGAVLLLGLRAFGNWLMAKVDASQAEREAYQALLEGMAKAQEAIVREAKKASADGKLTKEEMDAARTIAIEHAKAVAVGPGKDIVLAWSKERADSLIKQFLAKVK